MPKIDIASLPVDSRTNYPEPLNQVVVGRSRKRLGVAAGLQQFGVNLTTLKPGAASALRHWHEKEDELVYLLEGELVLVEEDNETVLKPGDAAGFKANVANGHHLVGSRRGLSGNRHPLQARARRISRRRSAGHPRRVGRTLHAQGRQTLFQVISRLLAGQGDKGRRRRA